MTDAELGAERIALLGEQLELEAEHARLHERPDDSLGHQQHRERLEAHTARIRAYRDALRKASDT
jgi:hypothetical protein